MEHPPGVPLFVRRAGPSLIILRFNCQLAQDERSKSPAGQEVALVPQILAETFRLVQNVRRIPFEGMRRDGYDKATRCSFGNLWNVSTMYSSMLASMPG
jgi:hypothetical protein